MTETPTLELKLLRSFSPLDGLKNENLRALARKTALRELGQGRLLFKEGDADKRTIYLVSGVVDLLTDGRIVGTVIGGTPEARHPLAPDAAAPLPGAGRFRPHRVPVDRQRPARRAAHLGPDRDLRGRRPERPTAPVTTG